MQRRKMLAILTAGTAITAAVGLAHHAPSAQASPLTEAPAFRGMLVRGFNPDELPVVIQGRRALGEFLENEPRDGSLAPYVLTPRKRAEGIFANDTLNKPACGVVKEMQKPTDPNAMPVEPITSLSESHVTQVAGAYCTVREAIAALDGLAG